MTVIVCAHFLIGKYLWYSYHQVLLGLRYWAEWERVPLSSSNVCHRDGGGQWWWACEANSPDLDVSADIWKRIRKEMTDIYLLPKKQFKPHPGTNTNETGDGLNSNFRARYVSSSDVGKDLIKCVQPLVSDSLHSILSAVSSLYFGGSRDLQEVTFSWSANYRSGCLKSVGKANQYVFSLSQQGTRLQGTPPICPKRMFPVCTLGMEK